MGVSNPNDKQVQKYKAQSSQDKIQEIQEIQESKRTSMQIKMAGNSSNSSESRVPMTLRDSFFNDDFFRNSWEDFDALRQQMISESQSFWKRAEQEMKMLESSSSAMQQQQSSSSSSNAVRKESSSGARDLMRSDSMLVPSIFPRRWMMPRMFGMLDTGALDTTGGAFGE